MEPHVAAGATGGASGSPPHSTSSSPQHDGVLSDEPDATLLMSLATVRRALGSGSNAVVLQVAFPTLAEVESKVVIPSDDFARIVNAIPPSRKLALKVLSHFWDEAARRLLDCERRVIRALPYHPNVIRVWSHFKTRLTGNVVPFVTPHMQKAAASSSNRHSTTQCFVMDFHPITLDQWRMTLPIPMPWFLLWRVARELLAAVCHMYAHNVAHLDFKLDNVMVGYDGRCVLADFGIARQFESRDMLLTYKEPFDLLMNMPVLAPEVLAAHARAKEAYKAAAAATVVAVAQGDRTSSNGNVVPPPLPPQPLAMEPGTSSSALPGTVGAAHTAPTAVTAGGATSDEARAKPHGAAAQPSPLTATTSGATSELTLSFAAQSEWSVGLILYELATGFTHEPTYPDDGGGVRSLHYSTAALPPLPTFSPLHERSNGLGASRLSESRLMSLVSLTPLTSATSVDAFMARSSPRVLATPPQAARALPTLSIGKMGGKALSSSASTSTDALPPASSAVAAGLSLPSDAYCMVRDEVRGYALLTPKHGVGYPSLFEALVLNLLEDAPSRRLSAVHALQVLESMRPRYCLPPEWETHPWCAGSPTRLAAMTSPIAPAGSVREDRVAVVLPDDSYFDVVLPCTGWAQATPEANNHTLALQVQSVTLDDLAKRRFMFAVLRLPTGATRLLCVHGGMELSAILRAWPEAQLPLHLVYPVPTASSVGYSAVAMSARSDSTRTLPSARAAAGSIATSSHASPAVSPPADSLNSTRTSSGGALTSRFASAQASTGTDCGSVNLDASGLPNAAHVPEVYVPAVGDAPTTLDVPGSRIFVGGCELNPTASIHSLMGYFPAADDIGAQYSVQPADAQFARSMQTLPALQLLAGGTRIAAARSSGSDATTPGPSPLPHVVRALVLDVLPTTAATLTASTERCLQASAAVMSVQTAPTEAPALRIPHHKLPVDVRSEASTPDEPDASVPPCASVKVPAHSADLLFAADPDVAAAARGGRQPYSPSATIHMRRLTSDEAGMGASVMELPADAYALACASTTAAANYVLHWCFPFRRIVRACPDGGYASALLSPADMRLAVLHRSVLLLTVLCNASLKESMRTFPFCGVAEVLVHLMNSAPHLHEVALATASCLRNLSCTDSVSTAKDILGLRVVDMCVALCQASWARSSADDKSMKSVCSSKTADTNALLVHGDDAAFTEDLTLSFANLFRFDERMSTCVDAPSLCAWMVDSMGERHIASIKVVEASLRFMRFALKAADEPLVLTFAKAGLLSCLARILLRYMDNRSIVPSALHALCNCLTFEACRAPDICPFKTCAETIVAVLSRPDYGSDAQLATLGVTALRNLACVQLPALALPPSGAQPAVSAEQLLSPALQVALAGVATVVENAMETHASVAAVVENGRCALYNMLLIGASDARTLAEAYATSNVELRRLRAQVADLNATLADRDATVAQLQALHAAAAAATAAAAAQSSETVLPAAVPPHAAPLHRHEPPAVSTLVPDASVPAAGPAAAPGSAGAAVNVTERVPTTQRAVALQVDDRARLELQTPTSPAIECVPDMVVLTLSSSTPSLLFAAAGASTSLLVAQQAPEPGAAASVQDATSSPMGNGSPVATVIHVPAPSAVSSASASMNQHAVLAPPSSTVRAASPAARAGATVVSAEQAASQLLPPAPTVRPTTQFTPAFWAAFVLLCLCAVALIIVGATAFS